MRSQLKLKLLQFPDEYFILMILQYFLYCEEIEERLEKDGQRGVERLERAVEREKDVEKDVDREMQSERGVERDVQRLFNRGEQTKKL